ncbi:F-box domain-containing protein [Madurella fahalii]|uniref:F-box domain-containing protein n=1 Tax=Madurella fahalii TaxID=1157608 RepID=A0ABQ0GDZ9_9PEZI
MQNLVDLPEDILLIVFASLESARDLRALALSCRRLHHLVQNEGWRIFVKTRFPSLSVPVPATGGHTWQQLAESLTWQSRCWDRRSLQFQVLLPNLGSRRDGRPPGGSRGLFHSIVDVHYDPNTQQELVVWGAGEDIVARYRERRGRGQVSETSWRQFNGKELGLSVGYDDVRALKIVRHRSGRAIITGRHNGQLSLLSAEPSHFGECIARFGCSSASGSGSGVTSHQTNEQQTINSLDILQTDTQTLVAAATQSAVRVYGLPEDDTAGVLPLDTYDLKGGIIASKSTRLCRARWMEQGQLLALTLTGCSDPLRYIALTPSGWTHHAAAKNAELERQFDIKFDRALCPNSLEPVHRRAGARGGTSLLLSSWRDGTCRLQDLRTPSPFDAVYQDNVDPWSDTEALMAYGAERFVAGGGHGVAIKVFDFRWTKGYYHTSGLPCLSKAPFPRPHQPFLKPPTTVPEGRAICDHTRGLPCHWHRLSRRIYYRPNTKYFLSMSLRAFSNSGIWSLARASDISPNFYIGISGAVIEANLEPCPDTYPPDTSTADPNFGFEDWRAAVAPESGYKSRPLVPSMMEIGDGYAFKGNDRSILLPNLLTYYGPREWTKSCNLRKHHRLDNGYHHESDFLSGVSSARIANYVPPGLWSDGIH